MRRFLAPILLPVLIACSAVQQWSDLALDESELQGRFKTPMGLTLTNGWLVISVPDAGIHKVPAVEARAYAKTIARFAYAHYRHPKAIEQIGVQFVGSRDGRTRVTYLAGSWPISHLSEPPFDAVPSSLSVRPFEDTLIETLSNGGRTDTIGTLVQSLRFAQTSSWAWWQQVAVFHAPRGGDAFDSLRLDPTTLLPSLETRHNRRGFSRIIYEGRRVHGVLDSAATFTAFDTTCEAAPFASAEVDAVIRAQPLDSGFVTRLPLYYPGKIGCVWATLRVVGVDSAQYLVELAATPGTDRYWIARSTRALLAIQDVWATATGAGLTGQQTVRAAPGPMWRRVPAAPSP